jgi:hypothetical protein
MVEALKESRYVFRGEAKTMCERTASRRCDLLSQRCLEVDSDEYCFCWAVDFSMSEMIRDLGAANVGCETAYRQDALRMIRSQTEQIKQSEPADEFVLLLASMRATQCHREVNCLSLNQVG